MAANPLVQLLPAWAMVAMDGEAFATLGTTATACVQADPGQAAATAIYNDNEAGGPTWIFDELYAVNAVSATAIEDTALYAAVFPGQATKPAATQTSSMNMRAGSAVAPNLRVAFGITLDAAPIWKPVVGGVHA